MAYSLYNGEVQLDFNGRYHSYTVDGRPVPSVTKITGVIDKPALIYWAVNCTVEHLEETLRPGVGYTAHQIKAILDDAKGARYRASKAALNIGSEAHDWIERYIKATLLRYPLPAPPIFPPVQAAVSAYLAWERDHEVTYLSSERKIYSRLFGYCGTCDTVLRWDGRLVVADFKTSKAIYPEYFLQVAAYAQAIQEEDGEDVGDLAIIRIPKDGAEVEVATASERGHDLGRLFGVFQACLSLYRWLEEVKE